MRLHVRFRTGPGATEAEYEVRRVNEDNVAWISREYFPAGALDFQIIYSPREELMMPLFNPRVTARVP